jgi:cystathionine gamma-synthase
MIYPSTAVALRCVEFFRAQVPSLQSGQVRVIELVSESSKVSLDTMSSMLASVSAVLFPEKHFMIAKAFWQHSGEGVSSRRAEYCHRAFKSGILFVKSPLEGATDGIHRVSRGPKRYQKGSSIDSTAAKPTLDRATGVCQSGDATEEGREATQYVEERFGRNLDLSLAQNAKLDIRRRIVGCLTANVNLREALDMAQTAEPVMECVEFLKQMFTYSHLE